MQQKIHASPIRKAPVSNKKHANPKVRADNPLFQVWQSSLSVCSHKVYKWRIYNGRHVRYVQKSPVRMSPSYVPFMCPLRVCSSCMPFICPFRVFALCALCVCLPSLCLSLRVSLRVSDPCLFYVSFLCAPLVCLFCLSLLLCLPSVCSMLERVYA